MPTAPARSWGSPATVGHRSPRRPPGGRGFLWTSVWDPPWRRHPLDRWIEVESLAAAALLVGRVGRRAWLTVGAGSVAPFAPATGVRFLVRLVDPPRERLPLRFHEV